MGIFCMVLGCVVLVAFIILGHILGIALTTGLDVIVTAAAAGFGDLAKEFLRFPDSMGIRLYLVCLLVMLFFGLMIGIGVFMNGLVYKRLGDLNHSVRRLSHRLGK